VVCVDSLAIDFRRDRFLVVFSLEFSFRFLSLSTTKRFGVLKSQAPAQTSAIAAIDPT
jgi:hypothetical protein